MRCGERNCPFPAMDGEELCRHHWQLFALDEPLLDFGDQSSIRQAVLSGELRTVGRRFFWEYYELWDSEGRCTNCGAPRDQHTKTCSACRAAFKAMYERLRDARHDAGLCPACGGLRDEKTKKICSACRAPHRRRYHEITDGLCKRCQGPKDRGEKVLCGACASKAKSRYQNLFKARRAAGVCSGCGRRRDRIGRKLCSACIGRVIQNSTARYERLRKAGLCISCERPTGGSVHCPQCRTKHNHDRRNGRRQLRCALQRVSVARAAD